MGLAFSCPGDDALDEGFEALIMRSLSLNGENVKSTLRSVSFNGRDSEPAILKAFGSGKLIIEGSLSFRSRETDPFQLETTISITSPTSDKENPMKTSFKSSRFCPLKEGTPTSPVVELSSPKHQAAVKLQKVYKSFRTRRQLADCAVLVEQRWWKLLDFALLKRSSISFFDIEEPESVVSRWLRARRRAATLGKGLSKDEKAQKLALQHWLEAIDPRHRYGHNLHFYYDCWLHCESKQPFFYWLDVGEGKEVNIEAKCTRSMLQHQCIKYLGPQEREAYEVIVEGGKFLYKQSGKVLDTSGGSEDSKWIFVLSTLKTLYVGQKNKGTFQHSSFLAGGATSAAGRLVVEDGILKAVWPHSGHYRPTEENFQEFMSYLKENNVDLTDVKQSPIEEGEELNALQSFRSELDLTIHSNIPETEVLPSHASHDGSNSVVPKRSISLDTFKGLDFSTLGELKSERDGVAKRSSYHHKVHSKINLGNWEGSDDEEEANGETNCILESKRLDSNERSGQLDPSAVSQSSERKIVEDTSLSEEPYMFCKPNLFVEEEEEGEEASVPQELILRRINSKKGMKSYQLGKQLSCKWTTGAGPRIGCVRDYPSELQFRALEQVNLSPRSDGTSRNSFLTQSPKPYISPRNNTSIQSPRMQEMPLLRVPLLQTPNIHRYKR